MGGPVLPDRNLALEAVRVTEAAAVAAAAFVGRGDERSADAAAMSAMCVALAGLQIEGVVRMGPGGDDAASLLHVGEKVGAGRGPLVDVALIPLEGATIIARGGMNALSIMAMAEGGNFLNVPDVYMNKIAVGRGVPSDAIDLDRPPSENLNAIAEAKGVAIGDLVVCILDRPRHFDLIEKVRASGARIMLITDGDVSGAVATTLPASGVDVYMGIGSAPQGVVTAAALRCAGGAMQGRLVVRGDDDRRRLLACGITEFDRKYREDEMATGDLTFAATGITSGAMLTGVRGRHGVVVSQSLVMRSRTGTLRYVEAHHNFGRRV